MDRNSVRLLGLLLLLPSAFLGLMPFLAEHTQLLNSMRSFDWTLSSTTIANFHHDLNGAPIAQCWWGVWIIAVIGEIMLVGVNVFKPLRPNRFKINIHD